MEVHRLRDRVGGSGAFREYDAQMARILELAGWFSQYYALRALYVRDMKDAWHALPPEAVVVLSGPAKLREDGSGFDEETPENVERIMLGVASLRELLPLPSIPRSLPLILNGETEQLAMMEEVARRYMGDTHTSSLSTVAGVTSATQPRSLT